VDPIDALRPRREFALPFATALFPALYLVYRDANGASPSTGRCLGATHVGYALAGVVAGYVLAAVWTPVVSI
jgi:hypothetical protein